ncbi:carboxymuconolactone decarboxylase family protein [Allomuricauda sp. NBRC 101325]|uniref:carboxymuconolactone decarboxylase family protein n=1 Tax=Allomuricauda sp. NBRC 101325 TaxID=1113758 RepID=UPI0024A17F8E|nr:carboxymuconolactone decarboxylase family protein [Muricauda sp. NBRC 101325]GLU45159.1 carboxymuconolactone decarboxylase [Muricauda sp. NBRC 101325]
MKSTTLALCITLLATLNGWAQTQTNNPQEMNRTALTQSTYNQLFGGEALTGQGNDPELMAILQKFIFGEVFHTGVLDNKQRELITIVTLTTQQTLPQLRAHTMAALNIGIKPIEIREAVYQCAPFIGYPKTLNAVGIINEVFTERGITLPLEAQGTVTDEDRYAKGLAIQDPLYGNEIKEFMSMLPGNFKDDVPRFLTEACFGDYYTRGGLDVKTRELLVFSVLVTLGTEFQIKAHAAGNIKAGNSKETLIAAIVQCLPYVGFPLSINAINWVKTIEEH